jgi:hypothetical protein
MKETDWKVRNICIMKLREIKVRAGMALRENREQKSLETTGAVTGVIIGT